MPDATSHTYFSQRLRLHYLDWGNADAPPLLLLHGNRDHAHSWDWTARRFQDRYHVVAPDFRGHGDSQWTLGSLYAPAEYVYDVAQLVHQQSLAPVQIVAHSLGGLVALRYAGTYPEQVERLVVVDGTGDIAMRAMGRPAASDRMREWVESQRARSGRQLRRYPTLEDAYQRLHDANPHLSPEQARHLTIHGANQNEDGTYSWKFDPYTSGGFELDLPPDDVDEVWSNITAPVLLLTGVESWHVATLDEDALTGRFRDARHRFVDDAGHWIHHDQLDRFVQLVEDFLA